MRFTAPKIRARDDIVAAIYAASGRRGGDDWRRTHLGASQIGHECQRYLWLGYRWAMQPDHDGRMLRLFARGQREEANVIAGLRDAGYAVEDVDPSTRRQFVFSDRGFGGSCDGFVTVDSCRLVLEIKTSNIKQFEYLREKGVRLAKPQHHAQMQVYCKAFGAPGALYVAVCKDDDRIYAEQVEADSSEGERLFDLARKIIDFDEPPTKALAEFPPCKLKSADGTEWPCQYYDLCHGEEMPAKSCRSCVNWSSTKYPNGGCKEGIEQAVGCAEWHPNPSIVNAQAAAVVGTKVVWQFPSGKVATTGGE